MIEFLSNFLCEIGNVPELSGINHNDLRNSVDAILVKRLTQTNTLQPGRASHQTHIAITGQGINIFDTSETSCNVVNLRNNQMFSKNFVVRNNLILLSNNIELLRGNSYQGYSDVIDTYTNAAQTRRQNGDFQVEISYLTLDGEAFRSFRELLSANDYLVFLRKRGTFEFLCLAIPNVDLGRSTTIIL
ncbi:MULTISPECIES: hypothetical protein [Clostridium]|uniref:hypothetical protein n=1 Tax=Clostridium TaxID=1485 RepID=UPI0014000003|nr:MULTISPECIES: hypothetical protein [Clostridium]MBY6915756.1 hypothetical protein [Clostridium botulinum]NFI53321.1 hypothetical protein [Clostridium botulinum]NFO39234.1 hypothetical protein [Clostridium botulinum]NFQ40146.1 hypothetical protein [Clostridium botulinum]